MSDRKATRTMQRARGGDEVASRKHLQVALELTAGLHTPVPPYLHLHGPSEIELFAQGIVRIPPAKAQLWAVALVSRSPTDHPTAA